MASFARYLGGGAKAHMIKETHDRLWRGIKARQRISRQKTRRMKKRQSTSPAVWINWLGEELLTAQHNGHLSDMDAAFAALALNRIHERLLGKPLYKKTHARKLYREAEGGLYTRREVEHRIQLWENQLSNPKHLHEFLNHPRLEQDQFG